MSLRTITFTGTTTWTCPDNVTGGWLTEVGAGSGAPGTADELGGTGGAGSGELIDSFPVTLIPGHEYTIAIGTKGLGSAQSFQPTPGTQSSFDGFAALPARGYLGTPSGGDNSGAGGGVGGSRGMTDGDGGYSPRGLRESCHGVGGTPGGGGTIYSDPSGTHGGTVPTKGTGTGNAKGGGGGGSMWGGTNGSSQNGGRQNGNASHYGAGAGGNGGNGGIGEGLPLTGGDGVGGYMILMYAGPE